MLRKAVSKLVLYVLVYLLTEVNQTNAGLPEIARKHAEYFAENQRNGQPQKQHRIAKRSIECAPYDDDQLPVTFVDSESCDHFYRCNGLEPERVWCGRSPEFTTLWYDESSGTCMDVHLFDEEHQERCFLAIGAPGTTSNLKEVFIGRCLNWQLFEHRDLVPDGKMIDCHYLYDLFTKAFANKPACGHVPFGAYDDFLQAATVPTIPSDKLLFWSSIKDFSQVFANDGKRFFTLEDSLIGTLVDELNWCGQVGGDGINYDTCPPWGMCKEHPLVSFWEEASEHFAKQATKEAALMLDGSKPDSDAFRIWSFFATHEMVNFRKQLRRVNIYVAHAPGIPVRETCDTGSLLVLKDMLIEQGKLFTCQDNPPDVKHLLCVDTPNEKVCKKRIRPPKSLQVQGGVFGYSVTEDEGKKNRRKKKSES